MKESFEELGFDDVTTYIQSGNVIFRSGESSVTKLTGRIERALAAAFDYEASVVLHSREGVDRAYAGTGVLYFSRLTSRASQSRLSRIASMLVYKSMTIRNWNTTVKLPRMLEAPTG